MVGKTSRWVLAGALALALLSGCSPIAREYEATNPRFELDKYLSGELTGHGIFFDRSGRVKSRFKVEIHGIPVSQGIEMHEVITYVNGDVERRVWQIHKDNENQYSGTTPDVNGEAKVDTYGFAAQWHYQMALKVEDEIYNIDFDDWMYYLGDDVMLNRATASKFGFRVGEVMIAFRKK